MSSVRIESRARVDGPERATVVQSAAETVLPPPGVLPSAEWPAEVRQRVAQALARLFAADYRSSIGEDGWNGSLDSEATPQHPEPTGDRMIRRNGKSS